MRTITALEVRARFGQVVDEAAAGERIIIERAGRPIAAIVSLADLEQLDPMAIRERRRSGLASLVRMRGSHFVPSQPGAAALIRAERDRGHAR